MTDERRYAEDEVAEILDRATAPEYDLSQLPRRTGLTLAQIQEVGTEAGISAERIERAALSMAMATTQPTRQATLLGAPRSVERVVRLERPMSDEEWSRLVADLRQTFGAEGELEAHGTLRSWKHGGITAHLEPEGEGYRVRMRALNQEAQPNFWAGLSLIVGSILFLVLLSAKPGELEGAAIIQTIAGLFALGGVGMMGVGRGLLPRWAAKREAELEGVSQRITLLTAGNE